ncbi:ArnT family glycosyltransferase [Mucilaginibacter boryungensis]|uniref:Glycosyltransferase family 39 protein n=1 Tax=Mucilaginibacter boryungensis TaxID=768480 RepID=A0ABR9XD34_9SPHI|nr:glycosyltransferase family 39 protein [Mucilaginibacter boryungensis]MBE9664974.1 glycosyltransferase family 39 protein [Mucilaginibacter boryungensis]
MPDTALNTPQRSDKPIWYFLLCWTLLNTLQSYTLELHPDEAYYWLYSRFLDWGYYDHPPMVAIFIKLGDAIMHNELGLRLMTILASSTSIYLLWLILKRYAIEARWFILVMSGVLIFHIYGFTTTPDVPLFFFTTLFYYIYQKYIDEDKLKWALLLAVIIAGLLYSKYHGVLLIGFTVLSNIKLLKRRSFYLIVGLSAILYLPHILWQVNHNYPSLNYHLYERSAEVYDPITTLLYFPGQILMAGPLIGWFLFYLAFSIRVKDTFIRGLLVNLIGTVIFFWLNTLKGEVQSHWTLIAFAPLTMLVLIRFKQLNNFPKWFAKLAVANLLLIVALRIALISPPDFIKNSSRFQSYYGYRQWAKQVKQRAGNNYVIFISGFQEPSKYCYYTNSLKGFSYDGREYRRTQFDIWPIEDNMQHKRAYYIMDFRGSGLVLDSFKTARGLWHGIWVDSVRTFQKVDISTKEHTIKASPGQSIVMDLTINNPYNYPINFKNETYPHETVMAACFLQNEKNKFPFRAGADFGLITIQPHQAVPYHFIFKAPPVKGKYELIFSIRTNPFPGGRNSRAINFTVE